MANKVHLLLKKLVRSKSDHDGDYCKLDRNGVADDDDGGRRKRSSSPKGFIPVHVGQECKKYLVSTAEANSPAFREMLDKYQDHISPSSSTGPLAVPCSVGAFEDVLRRAREQTRSRLK